MQTLSLEIHPVSARCNMRCSYCFFVDRGDGRGPEDHGVMTETVLEETVAKALRAAGESCSFAFQGGEPTLVGLEFFQRLMAFERRHNQNGIAVRHTLYTNGLAIAAAWAEFLFANGFTTCVSLDANKQLHDGMRPDARGKDTHNRCLDAVRLLKQHGAAVSVTSVVTRAMASHPDRTFRYLRERDLRHVGFVPCREDPAAGPSPHAVDGVLYGRFLSRLFDLWYNDFTQGRYYSIDIFDNYVHMLAGQEPDNCAMSGHCPPRLVVEADGAVYPCGYFMDDSHRLGNIAFAGIADLLDAVPAREFRAASEQTAAECVDCEYVHLCRGGCRRDRDAAGDGGLNVYCQSYREFFGHALPRLRELSRRLYTIYET